tara:strand:+ start:4681 stop:5133 length:453 start_codon:yes stop_codon:yes gene_type:complete
MILISHRGNITGPNPDNENKPDYILNAINQGYDVEIDIWGIDNKIFLGHDKPQYEVSIEWLSDKRIVKFGWFHCKNLDSWKLIKSYGLNSFFHNNDDYTLTSKGYIWSYPGKEECGCICVMPEWDNRKILDGLVGICSDHISSYKLEMVT